MRSKTLSRLLSIHYGKRTIILIDEYDVPLDKAFTHGYYNEMVSLVRGIFGEALKTNDFSAVFGIDRMSQSFKRKYFYWT